MPSNGNNLMLEKIKSYLIGIVIPVAVGLLSAFLTKDNMNIYDSITRPNLAPPALLFPIAWSILYVLMGISSTMIYRSDADKNSKRRSLLIYGAQLAVNFFWSIIFFNQEAFLFSFIWLLLLLGLIIAMIINFKKINKTAAFLQIPYLIWVTFAGYLNLMIYILN